MLRRSLRRPQHFVTWFDARAETRHTWRKDLSRLHQERSGDGFSWLLTNGVQRRWYSSTKSAYQHYRHQHPQQQQQHFHRFSSSSSSSSSWPYYVLASIPTLIWIRDCFVDVVRVDGRSMEPTLQAGDWVLVRKADGGALLPASVFRLLGGKDENNPATHDPDPTNESKKDNNNNKSSSSASDKDSSNASKAVRSSEQQHPQLQGFLSSTEVALLRSKIDHYEHLLLEHSPGVPRPWFYSRPPMVLPGQVVVIKSPQEFNELQIKRVIAMGGQWLQVVPKHRVVGGNSTESLGASSSSHSRLQLLPPYSVHVEGDQMNPADNETTSCSIDSRDYGPVSKNCLVGVAECIVWPPRRWQTLRIARTPTWHGRARAFWRASPT